MSKILDALKKLEAERARAVVTPARLDLLRVEQFLELQRHLLVRTTDPDALPDRLAQALGTFCRTAGVAIGVVRDGIYRILATYDRSKELWADDDGYAVAESQIGSALVSGRPFVLRRETSTKAVMRDLVLPFPSEAPGALHLIAPDVPWRDEEIIEARALSVLVGVALANAGLCSPSE